MLRGGGEDAAGRDEVHGAGVADETGEEVGGAGLHEDSAAGKDKAVFAGCVGDSGSFSTCTA